tara:strand:- start:11496 stop:11792 length:297 start_codon:yes stop_codon:yes gene_type:complete
MGRIQSKRITADTNIIPASNIGVFNGVILTPTDTISAAVTISIYADNTGNGTTNLVARYVLTPSSTLAHHYTDGILCRTGLRVESSSWTNLECFVLYS